MGASRDQQQSHCRSSNRSLLLESVQGLSHVSRQSRKRAIKGIAIYVLLCAMLTPSLQASASYKGALTHSRHSNRSSLYRKLFSHVSYSLKERHKVKPHLRLDLPRTKGYTKYDHCSFQHHVVGSLLLLSSSPRTQPSLASAYSVCEPFFWIQFCAEVSKEDPRNFFFT